MMEFLISGYAVRWRNRMGEGHTIETQALRLYHSAAYTHTVCQPES